MAETTDPALIEDGTWVDLETGERFDDDDEEKWKNIDLDNAVLEWTCPVCGETFVEPKGEDFEPAGWTSIHVPCATDEQIEEAKANEWAVEENIQLSQERDRIGW